MPVILEPDDYETWLQGDPDEAERLLKSARDELLTAYPVSKLVNSPRNDVAECLEAARV